MESDITQPAPDNARLQPHQDSDLTNKNINAQGMQHSEAHVRANHNLRESGHAIISTQLTNPSPNINENILTNIDMNADAVGNQGNIAINVNNANNANNDNINNNNDDNVAQATTKPVPRFMWW